MLNNSQYSRILAFSLLVALLPVVFFIGFGAHFWAVSIADNIKDNSAELRYLRQRLPQIAQLRNQHRLLVSKGARSGLLLQGKTDGIIGAELQRMLQNYAAVSGSRINTISVRKSQSKTNLQRFEASMSFSATIRQVRDLLYRLELSLIHI